MDSDSNTTIRLLIVCVAILGCVWLITSTADKVLRSGITVVVVDQRK